MVAEYLKRFPNKKVSMYLGEADALLTQLQSGRIHFCITDIYCPPDEYESVELFESETICVCSPQHPLAGKTVQFKELNRYRLVFRENDTYSHRNLMKILHTHNQDINTFHSYVEIGTINAVKKLIMEDIGISFIYRFVVQDDIDAGRLSQIHVHNFSSYHLFNFAWMKNSFFAPSSRQFLTVCQENMDHLKGGVYPVRQTAEGAGTGELLQKRPSVDCRSSPATICCFYRAGRLPCLLLPSKSRLVRFPIHHTLL